MQASEPIEESSYEVVDGPTLEQGDILPQCPIPMVAGDLPTNEADIPTLPPPVVDFEFFDVIVLSQTCDIIVQPNGRRKVDAVVVCPIWELPRLRQDFQEFRNRANIENIIKGRIPTWCALAPCELAGFQRPHMFVEFRRLCTISADHAERVAAERSPRLRLRSPYREHVAAAFGGLFSRPALPTPVPGLPALG